MTKVATAEKAKKTSSRSYKIAKEGGKASSYYVTRTEDGKVLDRTRVLVPSKGNILFSREKLAG